MKEALKAIEDAERAIWALATCHGLGENIVDLTDYPWMREREEISWWETKKPDPDDPEYQQWGPNERFWVGETHTIAILDDSCGGQDACVFSNDKELKGPWGGEE